MDSTGGLFLDRFEARGNLAVELSRRHCEIQRHGRVFEILGDLEFVDVDAHCAFAESP